MDTAGFRPLQPAMRNMTMVVIMILVITGAIFALILLTKTLCVCERDHDGGADGDDYCCDKANAGMMMLMVVAMTTKKMRRMRVGDLVMMMMMMMMMAEMAMVMKMPCLRYASSF